MKFDALFEAGFKELGARFFLVAFLPLLSVVLLICALSASGAPTMAPSWSNFLKSVNEFDLNKAIGLLLVVLALSLVTMPLQDALVRVLEGYWGDHLLSSWFGEWRLEIQEAKRRKLVKSIQDIPSTITPSEQGRIDAASRRLAKYFPSEDRLLPTSLGNALRAAEDLATRRYELDAVAIWPRLYPHIGDGLGRLVDSSRNQLDVAVRLVPTLFVNCLVSLGCLWRFDWWILVPLAFLAMTLLAYRAAIESAAAFGVAMNSAIDCHRFDMLKALHLPMPADETEEKRSNAAISNFLRQGLPHGLSYVHPESDSKRGSE